MKPKTKLHFEVLELSKRLSEPKEHEAFINAYHDHHFTTHYKNFVCLECNHQWRPSMEQWAQEIAGVECPSCGKHLKKARVFNNRISEEFFIYSDAKVVDRFQVVRYFSCWKYMSKTKKPEYHYKALFEEWKDWEKDKRVIMGRTIAGWAYNGDGFTWSDYSLRSTYPRSWKGCEYDRVIADLILPDSQFLPRFNKFGMSYTNHGCDLRKLLRNLEASPKVETLFKAKESKLLQEAVHGQGRFYQYWSQIKIAFRHGYKVTDPTIWYDYIDLLSYFRKDIHSPKYLFPNNLMKEHDRLMKKKEKIEEAIRRERKIREALEKEEKLKIDAQEYIERCQKYFGLQFTQDEIEISILKSVDEFLIESKEMHHCIFTNEYYNKKESLVFSAKVNGKSTETIEVCAKTFTILQCRGKHNQPSKYHAQIKRLMQKNMMAIRKASRAKKSTKQQQAA